MVSSLTPTRRYTVDDLAGFPDDGKLRELVDGQIVEWDVPSRSRGALEVALAAELRSYVRKNRLGLVASGEVMVRILGSRHDVRGSDIEFCRRGRVSREDAEASASAVTPDFVAEIVSTSDRDDRVQAKVQDWLRAGVRLLWYVDPVTGTTTVYQGGRITLVPAEETLDGGDVIPGFQVRIRDLLDEIHSEMAE